MHLQQRFIDAAQLEGAQVAIVHGAQHLLVAGVGQLAQGGVEVAVGQLGGVQVRRSGGPKEQAAQPGQAQARLAVAQPAQHQPQAAIGVGVGVAAGLPGDAAQPRGAIVVGIAAAHRRGRLGRVQQVAVFGHKGENQAIDQTQQLPVVILAAELAAAQAGQQRFIEGLAMTAL